MHIQINMLFGFPGLDERTNQTMKDRFSRFQDWTSEPTRREEHTHSFPGLYECTKQTMKNRLSRLMNEKQDVWDEYFEDVCVAVMYSN